MMKRLLIAASFIAALLLALPTTASAQATYDVSYKNQTLEQVTQDLRRQTGYQFVYKKEIADGLQPITVTVKNATLEQLFNRVFFFSGLEYEIVKGKTVVLKKITKNTEFFKKDIWGVVTDQNDEPLPGVTVRLKGTETGVTTDIDGQFAILAEGKEPVLEFSYVGMKNKNVRVATKSPRFISVKLETDENLLDEVLVTGYQNIKRENATGSYQLISSKKLDERYTSSIVENLEGQIPGLMSYQNGMNGSGESALTIRGTSSFQARTNPLVVVDGLPIEGSIETINPYNIENITVLKDASAAAIYGARASNGVIVVTTKRAHQEKLQVDFSADLTISEKQNYDNYHWATAQEMIELERYNFNGMLSAAQAKQAAELAGTTDIPGWMTSGASALQGLLNYYDSYRSTISPVTRLLTANYVGDLSDSDLQSQLARMARNDYRKEWSDAYDRQRVLQQYNLSLRTRGKYLNSSIVLNYKGNNQGAVKERNDQLTFSYRGDLDITKWLKASFGTNIISERAKSHMSSELSNRNFYQPYMSMYNADGSQAPMEGYIGLDEPALQDPALGLKDAAYYPLQELDLNFNRTRRTNIRSFANLTATILPGWTVSGHFQYEDIYSKTNGYTKAESYDMRYLYDLYTQRSVEMVWDYDPVTWEEVQVPMEVVTHHIPEGGMLSSQTSEGAHYTFRAQTGYENTFAKKHTVEALAGFEFRESHTTSTRSMLIGYDEQTQTNRTGLVSLGQLKDLQGQASAIGPRYSLYGAPESSDYATSDVLHRFYSLYFTGNYTYDRRYSASVSYRVDKTDLFGADPEFRGRPLWSVGASWNIHNEAFMKDLAWLDALKLRTSYGLTGNIDSSVSSYLTASLENEFIYGNLGATLNTPPNDQLRWEKTASWNLGLDFSVLQNRLSGSLDYYLKRGSDLLTVTDLDPTTGWTSLTINNGKMTNRGVELQLNGEILKPQTRNSLGINAAFNIAYNRNKVTKVDHEVTSGHTNLLNYTLHKGYPVHSLFSYRFAGLEYDEQTGMQYVTWRDHEGEVHSSEVYSDDFKVEDAVYSGSLDPKVMSSFTPEITYAGFSLSAMFSYYGGHVMRANVDEWDASLGSEYGYRDGSVNASALKYWQDESRTNYVANGYMGLTNVVGYQDVRYMDTNVVPADYLKLRNVVLGYELPRQWVRKLSLNSVRLRVQMNNVATWARNKYDIDPEANSPTYGTPSTKTPRSYTMSLHVNF